MIPNKKFLGGGSIKCILKCFSAGSNSLEELLDVVEVHVLPHCVLHQRS